jgi:phosphatidylinositol alpha-1,6-mannosyltransferase
VKPLRILFVSHSFPRPGSALENMGGMQRVAMHLWDEFRKQPDVVAESLILEADWAEIGTKTAGFLFSLLKRLPETVASFKPDVVVFSSMVTASMAVPLRKKLGVPLVAINHGQDVTLPNFFYQRWIRQVLKRLDATISVSAATREQTVNRGMPPNKAFIIHNGFYPETVSQTDRSANKQKLFKKLGLTWDTSKPLLLTVGRQVKRKGHLWFISDCLPLVETPVNYLMIGDGPEAPAIRQKAAKLPNVWWAGRKSDEILSLAYHASDLFVMPNIPVPGDMEGFGIVLVEANAAGVPVIASRLEGMIDVIEDGQNGLLVDAQKPDNFASSIDAVLKENMPAFSARAREYAAAHFSWQKIIRQYVQVLSRVAERRAEA